MRRVANLKFESNESLNRRCALRHGQLFPQDPAVNGVGKLGGQIRRRDDAHPLFGPSQQQRIGQVGIMLSDNPLERETGVYDYNVA